MSTMQQPDVSVILTATAAVEVRKFMEAEGVTAEQGGLRVSVMPGGCSGFKYGLVIEDKAKRVGKFIQGFRKEILALSHTAGYEHPDPVECGGQRPG